MIRGLRRGGIVPGAVTKAYLPDVLISTALRLTVSGWTAQALDKGPFIFESSSILGTKWLNQISRTTLRSVQCIIMEVLSLLTSAGSVSGTFQFRSEPHGKMEYICYKKTAAKETSF